MENSDGIELILGSAEESIPSEILENVESILQELDYAKDKAIHLLSSFMKDRGEWYLGGVDVGYQSKKQECEFLLDFVFEADDKPHEYGYTYFQVCFGLREGNPAPHNRPHPFKFIVGFH